MVGALEGSENHEFPASGLADQIQENHRGGVPSMHQNWAKWGKSGVRGPVKLFPEVTPQGIIPARDQGHAAHAEANLHAKSQTAQRGIPPTSHLPTIVRTVGGGKADGQRIKLQFNSFSKKINFSLIFWMHDPSPVR